MFIKYYRLKSPVNAIIRLILSLFARPKVFLNTFKQINYFRCNGRSDCLVNSSNVYAGNDPCGGTYKYTDVAYSCVEPQTVADACAEQDTINIKCTTGSIKVLLYFKS